ncbi:MAG: hypothetical protein PHN88_08805 [Ignavibacteria bacterium]|nr:hypothetical protein [Ignavibacteria bacterium]
MANAIITFNVTDNDLRDNIEDFLKEINMTKEFSNQTVYFGTLSKFALRQISQKVLSLEEYFTANDCLTVYLAAFNTIIRQKLIDNGKLVFYSGN